MLKIPQSLKDRVYESHKEWDGSEYKYWAVLAFPWEFSEDQTTTSDTSLQGLIKQIREATISGK